MSALTHEHAPGEARFEAEGVATLRGDRNAHHHRFAIVVARFNSRITTSLYQGAVRALLQGGAESRHIFAVEVPGAVEIPLAAARLASADRYAGIVALGCVIRGDTPHFEYVCQMAADGCRQVSLNSGLPVGFGVLTCDSIEQAVSRAGDERNAGTDAANAVLEMVDVLHQFE